MEVNLKATFYQLFSLFIKTYLCLHQNSNVQYSLELWWNQPFYTTGPRGQGKHAKWANILAWVSTITIRLLENSSVLISIHQHTNQFQCKNKIFLQISTSLCRTTLPPLCKWQLGNLKTKERTFSNLYQSGKDKSLFVNEVFSCFKWSLRKMLQNQGKRREQIMLGNVQRTQQ
jgi:hypothetical protein